MILLIEFGDVFWHDTFVCWGVVVEYISDFEWYYVLEGGKIINRAESIPSDFKWDV